MDATSNDLKQNVSEVDTSNTTFTMTAIGDVMCHNTQYWDAYIKETDDYDFSYVFDDINRYIKTADIAIGSLETSFASKECGYSNYPTFNSPDNLAYSLKKLGIDVLSTAGNHCLDMGFSGLSRTIDVLDDANISHLGTYQTQDARDTILFKYVKGIKIAFINYTYGTNGIPIPSGKEFCVNLIDKDLIKKDIESTKTQNAENTRNSIILNLTITKHSDGKITIDKADYVPIYMYKGSSSKLKRMKVLDIEQSISNFENGMDTSIGQATYQDLKVQLEKIKSIVGPEF